jgi:hypothetical protein
MMFEKLRDAYLQMSTGIDTIMYGQGTAKYEDQTIKQPKDLDEVEKRDIARFA